MVLAGSFSQTYKRNAINNGFLVIEAPKLVENLLVQFGTKKLTIRTGMHGIINFKNGVRATIELCEDIGTPELLIIHGSIGRVIINKNDNEFKIYSRNEEDKTKKLGEYDLPLHEIPFESEKTFDLVELTKKMIENLCFNETISCSGGDGLAALEIALAFHLSEREGNKKISLPLQEKEFDVKMT